MRIHRRLFIVCGMLVLALRLPGAAPSEGQPLRVLTIGNSFAENAVKYLEEISTAAGKRIEIFEANLSSHSLENHAAYLTLFETDPENSAARPYKNPRDKNRPLGLVEVLDLAPWDFVTIQQVSHLSYKPETYEPYAGMLIAQIRKHAPGAQILIHQTWAYREDHALFKNGFTQAAMAEGLAAAYRTLAARYGCEIIPVGAAFQRVRNEPTWKFRYPDPGYDYEHPLPGKTPRQEGSLNRGWVWRRNRTTGTEELALDAIHANTAGCYLAAAVWFEVIFGEAVTDNSFVPPDLAPADAAFLRAAAHATVVGERRPQALSGRKTFGNLP